MPTIEFEHNNLGPSVSIELEGGGRLIDVCDDAHAPVGFSCRAASCGTCRVEVLAGQALLAPPAPDEAALLETLAAPLPRLAPLTASASPRLAPLTASASPRLAPPTHRLACQAVVLAGAGVIRLRWVGTI